MHNDESNNKISQKQHKQQQQQYDMHIAHKCTWKSSSIHFAPLSRSISLTLSLPFDCSICRIYSISSSHSFALNFICVWVACHTFFCLSSVVIDTYFLLTVCMYNDIAHIHTQSHRQSESKFKRDLICYECDRCGIEW